MIKNTTKKYMKFAIIFTVVFACLILPDATLSYGDTKVASGNSERFYNPFKRTKHGPPLKNVTHKVGGTWLFDWIKNPKKYDPNSRMPNLQLEDDEVEAVMAYLASIADKDFPTVQWDDFLIKPDDDLTNEEFDAVDRLIMSGKGIWGVGRCSICHAQKGVGGYVTVAPDLGSVAAKINRDWLYSWLKNPRDYFPDTMMPQYSMSGEEIRSLVEFILKDYDFMPEEDEDEDENGTSTPIVEITYSTDPALIEKGKRVITLSRCVVCHDIDGIDEVFPVAEEEKVPTEGFAKLVYKARCLTCHNIRGEGGTYAPELTFAGSKLTREWIVDFLERPDIIRPIRQQMPRFYLTEEEAKIAANYIKKNFVSKEISTDLFKETKGDEERIEKGKKFFYDYGCNACHAAGSLGGVIGPNFGRVGDRLEPGYIYSHLKDPQHAGLDTAEPRYNLTDEEITNLVHFLLTYTEKGDN